MESFEEERQIGRKNTEKKGVDRTKSKQEKKAGKNYGTEYRKFQNK